MTAGQTSPTQIRCAVSRFDREAEKLAQEYESVSFEQVHRGIVDLIPAQVTRILDVGAGSGRDAAALATRGHVITAVEPSEAMRRSAAELHPGLGIDWIDDCLPELKKIQSRGLLFKFILVSAVWMYLPYDERRIAINTLAGLLAPSGLLIISLRHGAAHQDTGAVDVANGEVVLMARRGDLDLLRQVDSRDALERNPLSWTTLVFRKVPS